MWLILLTNCRESSRRETAVVPNQMYVGKLLLVEGVAVKYSILTKRRIRNLVLKKSAEKESQLPYSQVRRLIVQFGVSRS